jgi:hypothetical protein
MYSHVSVPPDVSAANMSVVLLIELRTTELYHAMGDLSTSVNLSPPQFVRALWQTQ